MDLLNSSLTLIVTAMLAGTTHSSCIVPTYNHFPQMSNVPLLKPRRTLRINPWFNFLAFIISREEWVLGLSTFLVTDYTTLSCETVKSVSIFLHCIILFSFVLHLIALWYCASISIQPADSPMLPQSPRTFCIVSMQLGTMHFYAMPYNTTNVMSWNATSFSKRNPCSYKAKICLLLWYAAKKMFVYNCTLFSFFPPCCWMKLGHIFKKGLNNICMNIWIS